MSRQSRPAPSTARTFVSLDDGEHGLDGLVDTVGDLGDAMGRCRPRAGTLWCRHLGGKGDGRIRKIGRVVAVALTALVGVLPAHGERDAWRYFASSGKVGQVQVPTTTFMAIYQGNVGSCCWYMDIRSSGSLWVHRARRQRGLQGVVVVASAQKWNGSNWSTRVRRSLTGVIPRGQRWVSFPQIGFMD
jgi:hypothetical protein